EREQQRQRRLRGEIRPPGPKPGSKRPPRCRPWDPQKDEPARLVVPEALDLEALPRELRWFAAYFVDRIKHRYTRWRANPDGSSQLKPRHLARVIPAKHLKKIRHLLEKMGVIEDDGSVIPGSKCRGYRLNPDYVPARR